MKALLLLLLLLPTGVHAQSVSSHNRIAAVVDVSGSMASQLEIALAQLEAYLAAVAQQRRDYWATSDSVFVVALDAIPSVLFAGTATDLRKRSDALVREVAARSDLRACTDVEGALVQATTLLRRAPGPAYLIVFSDLRHEPPLDAVTACAGATLAPPAGVPWEALQATSSTFVWAAPDAVLRWTREAQAKGVTAQFYTMAASAGAPLTPPPAAERVRTPRAPGSMQWLWWVGGGFVALVVLITLLSVFASRRAPAPRAAPRRAGIPIPPSRPAARS